jgi:hypothetical protein
MRLIRLIVKYLIIKKKRSKIAQAARKAQEGQEIDHET